MLRAIPFMPDLAAGMREPCPGAMLLNYTNPMGMLTWAVYKAYPDVPVVGLCHNVLHTGREVSSCIGVPREELAYKGAGTNHIVWLPRLEHGGEDAYPRPFAAMEDPEVDPEVYAKDKVRFELMRRFGYFVTESSEHNAEYTPYFLRDDELVRRYDVPVDEYVRRSEANLVEYAKTREKLLAGGSFPLERSVEYGSLIVHSVVTGEARTPPFGATLPVPGSISSSLPPPSTPYQRPSTGLTAMSARSTTEESFTLAPRKVERSTTRSTPELFA